MITFNSSSNSGKGSHRHLADRAATFGELVERRLRRNAYLSMEDIRCDHHDGVIRLSGHVATYFLKQMAQETVLGVSGVLAVENEVEVLPARPRPK